MRDHLFVGLLAAAFLVLNAWLGRGWIDAIGGAVAVASLVKSRVGTFTARAGLPVAAGRRVGPRLNALNNRPAPDAANVRTGWPR